MNKITFTKALLSLTILFCSFVFLFEYHTARNAQEQIRHHSRLIADDLWNFNNAGAAEYLKLAAQSGNYQRMTIFSHDGEFFQNILTDIPSPLERLGIRFKFIPKVTLMAPIEYGNFFIGWIEAVWIPQTLPTHLLVFAFLVMALFIIMLYTRLKNEKELLEERVANRTSELTKSNTKLIREIRERTAAEEALQENEKKYRLLAESIEDVILVVTPRCECTYMSPVCEKMFGWESFKLEGKGLEKIFTSHSLKSFQKLLLSHAFESRSNQQPPDMDSLVFEMRHKNGETVWCEIRISSIDDSRSGRRRVMCVARDITPRKKAEQEKETLQEQLERSKKMESLGLLAGGVAHDLNNVLSGIVSYPELILLNLEPKSPIRKRIETIRDSGIKAAEIVQDLLTLARRGVITSTLLNLNDLVNEYTVSPEHTKLISFHQDITINVDLEPQLPFINGSKVHLKKVIMNLVSNAAEAIKKPKGLITISTSSRTLETPLEAYQSIPPGDYVILSVSDSGEGIEQAVLKRIFEPFYTKKVMGRSGTGLGLTVVWGAVEDHKGFLDIESTVNQGTIISLYFPLTRDLPTEVIKEQITQQLLGNGEHILVVDDVEHQREIITDILTHLSYVVTSVESGEKALTLMKEENFDLVILDMIMGTGLDGLDTYKEILKINPKQKVIIASGYSATGRVKEAQELGAGRYLQKPYSLERISSVIHQTLTT